MKVSIVIRTYNEAKHIGTLLNSVMGQDLDPDQREIIIVDSGSTDDTLQIASCFPVRILHIPKEEFSFGRSLNIGCAAATGEALVFVSGHCIPVSETWLSTLIAPLRDEGVVYSYGGQLGDERSRFSETQIFAKHFPPESSVSQDAYFSNNANSALLRKIWISNRFDEELPGLEDMHLAKRLVREGYKIAYVANAAVHHIHEESWGQVKRRYEREAIALREIIPGMHVTFGDFARYWLSAVALDLCAAAKKGMMLDKAPEIALYRLMQYWGAYRGNHLDRRAMKMRKDAYYYPRKAPLGRVAE
jgi:rhamnosyltransferase